jgi:isopenicillin N synthase-like dioxygenase
MSTSSLPVLDMRDFFAAPQSAAGQDFVLRLRDACHGPGFCYLVGHGVPPELDRAIMTGAKDFFALPERDRRALAIARSPHFRGYTALGDERTKGVSDWREQLDVGPEEPALTVAPSDPPWLRLRGPNQWPARLPSLQPTVLAWMRAMDRVGLAVLRALALGLGQPFHHFDAFVLPRGDPHLKIIRYPAQPRAVDPGQGVGMHHDSGLVSFVLQDEVGGLQVEQNGRLLDATPLPGSYVMNLGEMLQAATAGYLRATPHRVQSPPPNTERLSVAYFFHPRSSRFEPIAAARARGSARGGRTIDPNDRVFATFGDNI